jgi:hypothetical protein
LQISEPLRVVCISGGSFSLRLGHAAATPIRNPTKKDLPRFSSPPRTISRRPGSKLDATERPTAEMTVGGSRQSEGVDRLSWVIWVMSPFLSPSITHVGVAFLYRSLPQH